MEPTNELKRKREEDEKPAEQPLKKRKIVLKRKIETKEENFEFPASDENNPDTKIPDVHFGDTLKMDENHFGDTLQMDDIHLGDTLQLDDNHLGDTLQMNENHLGDTLQIDDDDLSVYLGDTLQISKESESGVIPVNFDENIDSVSQPVVENIKYEIKVDESSEITPIEAVKTEEIGVHLGDTQVLEEMEIPTVEYSEIPIIQNIEFPTITTETTEILPTENTENNETISAPPTTVPEQFESNQSPLVETSEEIAIPEGTSIQIPDSLQAEELLELPTSLDDLQIGIEIPDELKASELAKIELDERHDFSAFVKRNINLGNLLEAPATVIDDVVRVEEDGSIDYHIQNEQDPWFKTEGENNESSLTNLWYSFNWKLWVGCAPFDSQSFVFSFSEDETTCAAKLNSKLAEKGMESIPNPDAGIEQTSINEEWEMTRYFDVYRHKVSGFYCGGFMGVQASSRRGALEVARRLNARCRQKGMTEPNAEVGCEFEATALNNVWVVTGIDGESSFVGQTKRLDGSLVTVHAKDSAEECAIDLNRNCLEQGLNAPNPTLQPPSEEEPALPPMNTNFNEPMNEMPMEQPSTQSQYPLKAKSLMDQLLGNSQPALTPFNDPEYYKQPLGYGQYDAFRFPEPHDPLYQGFDQPRRSRISNSLPAEVGGYAQPPRKYKKRKPRRYIKSNPHAPRRQSHREQFGLFKGPQKSRYKGVYWETRDQKWRARVYCGGKRLSGGSYTNEREAALAVNRLCEQMGMMVKNPELDSIKLADEDCFIVKEEFVGRDTPFDVLNVKSEFTYTPRNRRNSYSGYVKQEPRYGGYRQSVVYDELGGW